MLKQQLQEQMKAAMKGGEKRRLGIIRLILAAIKQREVDERIELDDSQVVAVLDKMLKQRRDSITQYESAGRTDLAEQEHYESGVVQEFMPAALTAEEIEAAIHAAIKSSGASSIKEMGKVIAALKPQLQGRADMGAVSAQVKQRLSG